MKRTIFAGLFIALFATSAYGQVGVSDPIGVEVLPPPPGQVGDPSAVDNGGTIVLTNRGRVMSDPVQTDDLHVHVTLVFPTFETLDNGEVYRDNVRVVIGATGDDGLQQNRPWEILEPGTVVVTVTHTNVNVVVMDPDTNGDGFPEPNIVDTKPINTADGGLPLELDILIHEGVIDVVTSGEGGAGGDTITTSLPGDVNPGGNVVIYNREKVAGVTFVTEVSDLQVNGVPYTGGGNAPPEAL